MKCQSWKVVSYGIEKLKGWIFLHIDMSKNMRTNVTLITLTATIWMFIFYQKTIIECMILIFWHIARGKSRSILVLNIYIKTFFHIGQHFKNFFKQKCLKCLPMCHLCLAVLTYIKIVTYVLHMKHCVFVNTAKHRWHIGGHL